MASVEPVQGLFQDDAFEPQPADIDAAGKPGAMAAAVPRAASISSVALDGKRPIGVLRSAAAASSRDEGPPHARASPPNDAAPELTAPAPRRSPIPSTRFRAVISEQRTVATAYARRMKTMLTVIVCMMLATVATGIAQTVVLLHMSRDGKLQQDRMEQLMLNPAGNARLALRHRFGHR